MCTIGYEYTKHDYYNIYVIYSQTMAFYKSFEKTQLLIRFFQIAYIHSLIVRTLQDVCTHEKHTLFSISGDQGVDWHEARISIPEHDVPHDFRLRFIGVIGASYLSDAALDDITVMSGSCGEGMFDRSVYSLHLGRYSYSH